MEEKAISKGKHRKHGKTKLAPFGEFGRLEVAIMGTPCGNIKQLASEVINTLPYKMAYVDADHQSGEKDKPIHLDKNSQLVYTDKISHQRIDYSNELLGKFQRKALFNEFELVIVNGNHFKAQKQILVIDPKKDLKKKLDRINDVVAIILKDTNEIPDFLKEELSVKDIPVVSWGENDKIFQIISGVVQENIAPIKGLVLTGGKSTRMGRDKSEMVYHDKPQKDHIYEMIEGLGSETYLSCRPDQAAEWGNNYRVIPDSFDQLGPFGGILSAFREHPDSAWLVVACDLPLINAGSLQKLIDQRDTGSIATAYHNVTTGFPEPLITLWEPRAYSVLLHFLGLGYSCPRKVLINSNAHIIEPENQDILRNANNPEEYEKIMAQLQGS